jgi:hypothetical protein
MKAGTWERRSPRRRPPPPHLRCIPFAAGQVDEIITSTTPPNRRNDDPGWMWRTTESYVTGFVEVAKRYHQYVEYDVASNPSKTDNKPVMRVYTAQ